MAVVIVRDLDGSGEKRENEDMGYTLSGSAVPAGALALVLLALSRRRRTAATASDRRDRVEGGDRCAACVPTSANSSSADAGKGVAAPSDKLLRFRSKASKLVPRRTR